METVGWSKRSEPQHQKSEDRGQRSECVDWCERSEFLERPNTLSPHGRDDTAFTARWGEGMALALVLVIVAALAVLTVGLALDHAVEMRIAGNRKAAETAFRNAEAGLALAQQRLAQRFASDPVNLQRQRTGTAALPDWDFLFLGAVPYTGRNSRNDLYDEVKVDLGMDHRFKVFARLPEDRTDGAFHDLSGDNTRVVLRSVGFGPAGAEQETEMMVEAAAEPSASFAYAQEGGEAMPGYVNMKDRNAVTVTGSPLNTVR